MNNKQTIFVSEIRTSLKNVNYPGFNRDIISFGMVKNISIEQNNIVITLHINSDNKEVLSQLKQKIHTNLSDFTNYKIVINIQKPDNIHENGRNTQSITEKNSISNVNQQSQ